MISLDIFICSPWQLSGQTDIYPSTKVDPETLFNADESPPRAEPAPPEKDVSYQNDKLAIAGCWLYGKCPAITFMCLPILPLPAMNLELIG